MEWPIVGMEPSHSVRHNRAGRVYFMRVEALRMESLKDCEGCVDVCLSGYVPDCMHVV
jgi:hypothetical protein